MLSNNHGLSSCKKIISSQGEKSVPSTHWYCIVTASTVYDESRPAHSLCRRLCLMSVCLPSPLTPVAILLCHLPIFFMVCLGFFFPLPSLLSNTDFSNVLCLLIWPKFKYESFCFLKYLKRWLQEILSPDLEKVINFPQAKRGCWKMSKLILRTT